MTKEGLVNYLAVVDGQAGAYGVVVPDLPGCTAMGATIKAALANAADAARDWMNVTEHRGGAIPPPRDPEEIVSDPESAAALAEEGAFLAFLPVARAVRRKVKANLSLDAGALAAIDATAARIGVDRSRVVELLAERGHLAAMG